VSGVSQILSVALALIAACSNAASNVIQRATNREEAGVKTLSLRLVKDLLHRPLWFAGLGAVMLSFLLQASALRFGPLALVEPLIVFELPLTFIGAAMFLGARLGKREWGAAVMMTIGLAGLVYFLHTSGRHNQASDLAWAVGLAVCEGAVGVLVLAGRQRSDDARAALYGAATGIQFGTTAALMKGAVHHLSQGIVPLFESWETYLMVLTGIFAMFLVQNAMQSGKLVAAQPGITLLDPFVAILWGVFAFHERTTTSIVYLVIAAVGGLLMVVGAIVLSRSPILQHGHRSPEAASGAGSPPEPERALSH
jgi:drug/metabolite transporter (DMT)-like permease